MSHRVENVTCLGCGCGCDDLAVTVQEGRILEVTPSCPVGRAWFGDGQLPWSVVSGGVPASLEQAIERSAGLLVDSRGKCLVYLAPDLSSQAQRVAVAIADLLLARLDTATSETAAEGLLAAQRRGRAGATLGELRNRADVLMFWGVDPARRYPRYLSRYALEPSGTGIGGRAERFVISVGVGGDKGPEPAELVLHLEPDEEIPALSLMRASVLEHPIPAVNGRLQSALAAVARLKSARYAVLVHDGELSGKRDPLRAEALIALAQALNRSTRAALSTLRAGGNQVGADAVLTWQTGYPLSVNYASGYPRYRPEERGLEQLSRGDFRGVLIVGQPDLSRPLEKILEEIPTVVIGPRASEATFAAQVAIDTGVAGIHEEGTGYRMDEVPVRLRPPLHTQRSAVATLRSLAGIIRGKLARSVP